jgi:hypothetical protein
LGFFRARNIDNKRGLAEYKRVGSCRHIIMS